MDDYKVVRRRNEPGGWVAEAPSIPGRHALMPARESALTELAAVFQVISDEYAERSNGYRRTAPGVPRTAPRKTAGSPWFTGGVPMM